MKRSGTCKACGGTIRARAKGMSLGAAVRKHYWSEHREIMLGSRADREWDDDPKAGRRKARSRARR